MKFANTFKNIFIALTILSVISLTSSRRSKTKLTTKGDNPAAHGAKVVEYEVLLQIKDAQTLAEHKIKIDQETFNQMNYGIEFTMETGAITNPAFFLVTANTYLFNFKYAQTINCLNQASFTNKAMHFSVYVNNQSYEVNFVFPNGWAFGSNVDILSMCNKFYDKWSNTQSKRSQLENEIMKLYSHIKLLENTRDANANTKSGLQSQNQQLLAAQQQTNSTVIATRKEIEKLGEEINKIGHLQAAENSKLDILESEIKVQEAKMNAEQQFIDDTNGNINNIRIIHDSEINNEWDAFKVYLQKMIDLQSNEDYLKAKLQGYLSNVSGNSAAIMSALTLN